jgi:undecaprenyl-diphosphatase
VDPLLLYLTVLAAALGESTAFLGLAVPGVGIVLGAAILAARGLADPGWVGAVASAGAAAGFALSYWLGSAGGPRIARWGSRAQGALTRSRAFFERYGSWSVFWGHFFGPVRALVAFAAGASGMPARRFWPASLLGALAWGYGMALAGVAASGGWAWVEARLGRASVVLALLVALLYLALRLAAGALLLGLRLLPPTAAALLDVLERAAGSAPLHRLFGAHPAAAAWVRRRLEPDHATGLLLSAGILACGAFAWLFFGVAEDLLFREPLVRVDQHVFHLLQRLRSPGGDRLFLAVTQLGSAPVIAAALTSSIAGLLWLGRRFTAGLLLGGFALGEVLMWVLKQGVGRARPAPLFPLAFEPTGAFPSNHAFSSLALYGFLAYLASRHLTPRARPRLYAIVGVAVAAVGTSRLYLGVHWLSDVGAGYALAGLWLATLLTAAEAHRRFGPGPAPVSTRQPAAVAALVAVAVAATWGVASWSALRRAPPAASSSSALAQLAPTKLESTLGDLLARPVEGLRGTTLGVPNLALLGPRDGLVVAAALAGWVRVRPLDAATLVAEARSSWEGTFGVDSPVTPVFRRGKPEELALARVEGRGRLLLRLWKIAEVTGRGPVWAGWLQFQPGPRHLLGLAVPARPRAANADSAVIVIQELRATGRFVELAGLAGAAPLLTVQ